MFVCNGLLLLQIVLLVKILVTILAWAGPYLLMPESMLRRCTGFAPEPIVFARMLGVGWIALVAIYGWGYYEALAGRLVEPVIVAGLISNGGGALAMILGRPARLTPSIPYWASVGLLVLITIGLAVAWATAAVSVK